MPWKGLMHMLSGLNNSNASYVKDREIQNQSRNFDDAENHRPDHWQRESGKTGEGEEGAKADKPERMGVSETWRTK